jgi:hypothetical protein
MIIESAKNKVTNAFGQKGMSDEYVDRTANRGIIPTAIHDSPGLCFPTHFYPLSPMYLYQTRTHLIDFYADRPFIPQPLVSLLFKKAIRYLF